MRISGAPDVCKDNYADHLQSVKMQPPLILANMPKICPEDPDAAISLHSSIGKISLTLAAKSP
jgi:hypothetical protein